MIKNLITVVFLLGMTTCFAQSTLMDRLVSAAYNKRFTNDSQWHSTSMLYLRDGSHYIGANLGQDGNKMIFRLNTADTIRIPLSMINTYEGPEDVLIYKTGQYHYISSWFMSGSINFPLGYDYTIQVQGTLGWRFNKKYAAGVGMSIESHESSFGGLYISDEFLNFYGYGRRYLNDKKNRLFCDARVGYSYSLNNWMGDRNGGMLYQPGVGILFASKKSYHWYVGISNVFQRASGTETNFDVFSNPITAKYDLTFKQIMLSIGMELH